MNADSYPWLSALLQTADALFPTGAYAHSLGFEEAVRLGLVTNELTLLHFLQQEILPAQEHLDLPCLRWTYTAAARGDLHELLRLDRELSAWKLPHETRTASLQLGRRRLRALMAIQSHPQLTAFESRLTPSEGHHLTVCGLQASVLGAPLEAALHTWLYQALAGLCSAALKLIRIGQEACQRTLHLALAESSAIVTRSLAITPETAGWFNPRLEIASMRHEYAEERLFIS